MLPFRAFESLGSLRSEVLESLPSLSGQARREDLIGINPDRSYFAQLQLPNKAQCPNL